MRRVDDNNLLKLVSVALASEGDDQARGFRLAAHGEIDVDTAPRLADALDALVDGGATMVVLDASDIHFLDSSGLRVIVSAGQQLADRGGRLLIEGMSGAVQRVLEVSGVIEHFRS